MTHLDVPDNYDQERISQGYDYLGNPDGFFVWVPCEEPGCWGASKHNGTRCSRERCTKNTGCPDAEALGGFLVGAELVTAFVGVIE